MLRFFAFFRHRLLKPKMLLFFGKTAEGGSFAIAAVRAALCFVALALMLVSASAEAASLY